MLGVAQIKKCTNNPQVEIHFANRIRHKTLPFEAAFVIKKKGTGPICRALDRFTPLKFNIEPEHGDVQ